MFSPTQRIQSISLSTASAQVSRNLAIPQTTLSVSTCQPHLIFRFTACNTRRALICLRLWRECLKSDSNFIKGLTHAYTQTPIWMPMSISDPYLVLTLDVTCFPRLRHRARSVRSAFRVLRAGLHYRVLPDPSSDQLGRPAVT